MSLEYAFNPAAAQFADDLHALYAARHAEVTTRLASPDTSLLSKLHVEMGQVPIAHPATQSFVIGAHFFNPNPARTAESIRTIADGEEVAGIQKLAKLARSHEEPITERLQALCSIAVILGLCKKDGLTPEQITHSASKNERDIVIRKGVAALRSTVVVEAEEQIIEQNLQPGGKLSQAFANPASAPKAAHAANKLGLSRYARMALEGLFAEGASRRDFEDEFRVSTNIVPKPRDEHRAARVRVYTVDQALKPTRPGQAQSPESEKTPPPPDEPDADNANVQQFSYRTRWQEAVGADWTGSYIEQVEGPEAIGFAGYRILYLPDTYQGRPIETGVAVHPKWGNAMYIFPGERGVDPATSEVTLTPREVFLHARQRRVAVALGAIRLVHHDFTVYDKAMNILTTPAEQRAQTGTSEA